MKTTMKQILKVLSLSILLLSSCKSETELKGDVFVVTKGAQNVKLGLVEVRAIPQDEIMKYFKKQNEVSQDRAKSQEFSFNDLSVLFALDEAVTDADGKFTMRLPAKGKIALVAKAQRLTFGEEEKYYWIVWVSLDKKKSANVILSNDNMIPVNPFTDTVDLMFLLPSP